MQSQKNNSTSAVRFAASGSLRGTGLLMVIAIFSGMALAIATPARAADTAAKKEKGPQIPPPEDLVKETGDGLGLAMTYYPSGKGKQTIPVVLLHMWKQSRNDYRDLALGLQARGYAVIVPDLRGHGESTHLRGATRDETLDAAKMSPLQFTAMVTQDMRAVKDFLWNRNNAGELNIDKLCVVGAEMGASVALDFALADAVEQDRNRVRRPEYKLGRFVKGAGVDFAGAFISRAAGPRRHRLSRGPARHRHVDHRWQAGQQGPGGSQANPRHFRTLSSRAHRRQQDRQENTLLLEARHQLAGHQAVGPQVQRASRDRRFPLSPAGQERGIEGVDVAGAQSAARVETTPRCLLPKRDGFLAG